MERGQSRLTAQNYYDENCADMDIPLDVRLSPQENAARYFKQYAKAKTAEKYLDRPAAQGQGGTAVSGECPAGAVAGGVGAGLQRHPHGADGRRLHPPAGQKAARLPAGLQAPGIPHLRGAAGAGGPQQPPERPPDHQRRGQAGHLAPHSEDPRQPRHSLHRRRGAGRTEPAGGCVAGGVLLPGAGQHQGAGGLYAGAVREEARRGPSRAWWSTPPARPCWPTRTRNWSSVSRGNKEAST